MKAVIVMFDSLNRHMLPAYGCDWVKAPNFERLAKRTATFDRSYVCSMPCMPARRDFHTGRPNFLHRGWGPIEPFDDSMPQMLKEAGIYTHLATDHQHYWEDGGATYHQRYSTFDFIRGQEGDKWHPLVEGVSAEGYQGRNAGGKHSDNLEWQDRINRKFMPRDQDLPQPRTFEAGLRFLDHNHRADNWLLQIETFDPHEPFQSSRGYKDRYPEHYADYDGPVEDWPPYTKVTESPERVENMRYENASLISMCDKHLGDVLDKFDDYGLWDDTMLIVWTDHGFLLGEHECWAKIWMPFYEEIAHTPFFVWDPRSGKQGERRQALVQPSIDLPVTLLTYFGVEPTKDMLGKDLAGTVADDTPVRDAAIFGVFGGYLNVTDGRYVCMQAPNSDAPIYEYTLMPTRMKGLFKPAEMHGLEGLAEPFNFTKGCRTMKIAGGAWRQFHDSLLFDVEADPKQAKPLDDPSVEARLLAQAAELMHACDAPADQYTRYGLEAAVSG